MYSRRKTLAHAHDRIGCNAGRELRAAARQQDDHRRAHVEAADLVAARKMQRLGAVAIIPMTRPFAMGRAHESGPRRLHPRNEHRAHHDHRHGPAGGVEQHDETLDAREQTADVLGGSRCDAEYSSWHVRYFAFVSVSWYVDAVVISCR